LGCDFITNKLYPKLQANPKDIDMAKKIVAFILKIKDEADKSKCYKGEIFTKSVELIYSEGKTASVAEILANRCFANADEEGGIKYLNEAVELETDPAKKAENIMKLASYARKQGKLAEARNLALKAASTDASVASKAYSIIGDLYMSSYNQCKGGDAVQSRVVFLAAYDMYAKAGDSQGMSNARQQFPSITDAFTLGKKEGEAMSVGCWIGGSTTLRLRPRQ
jgi:tetratricopeptide (TPR) repeat protein